MSLSSYRCRNYDWSIFRFQLIFNGFHIWNCFSQKYKITFFKMCRSCLFCVRVNKCPKRRVPCFSSEEQFNLFCWSSIWLRFDFVIRYFLFEFVGILLYFVFLSKNCIFEQKINVWKFSIFHSFDGQLSQKVDEWYGTIMCERTLPSLLVDL